ncbi:hypothetical protein JCM33374_g1734 [Metschnikowia sp. JCM 33374]|nr:hypothetical protein JCM33374_g1734 [Metschnikowia sp. JCM 33374]
MPQISPQNYTFTKKVNESLEISLTFYPVPDFPEKFDCVVEFFNVHSPSTSTEHQDHGTSTENAENGESMAGKSPNGAINNRSWLSSLWTSEKSRLVPEKAPEVPLLLGYIQMLGYVRLNHQLGAETGSESPSVVYWKNSEYTGTYCSVEADEKVQQILHTELFKDADGNNKNGAKNGSKNGQIQNKNMARLGGVADLHAKTFDSTSHYLLHDLVHQYGTMDMPLPNAPEPTPHQQEELSTSLSKFVLPFYVTAQHLLFANTTLLPGQRSEFKFRLDVPPETLPPSYNTKSTGSVGEAGLASIAYSFVVGVQEEVDGEMKHRAVYFPMELRPGQYEPDRSWLQHNYLQETILDKSWNPEMISDHGKGEQKNFTVSERRKSSLRNSGLKADGDFKSIESVNEKKENNDSSKENIEASEIINNVGSKSGDPLEQGPSSIKNPTPHEKFLEELDSLIEGSLENLAAKERRKISVSYRRPQDRGLISQTPEHPRVSYQIRVNNQPLCVLTMSNAIYHVGDDVHFFLRLHPEFRMSSRVVGLTTHVEAHEIFHVTTERKILNIYKVTPTIKANTYADALMFPFTGDGSKMDTKTEGYVNLPRFLTQQFQSSTFMDLRYFMVFRFVLNEFPEMESYRIDEDSKSFVEYVSAYKIDNEANEFRFSIPLTVLPESQGRYSN